MLCNIALFVGRKDGNRASWVFNSIIKFINFLFILETNSFKKYFPANNAISSSLRYLQPTKPTASREGIRSPTPPERRASGRGCDLRGRLAAPCSPVRRLPRERNIFQA